MLVLSRKANEGILIGQDIEIVVLEVRGQVVRLGIQAPREIAVVRTELRERLIHDREQREREKSSEPVRSWTKMSGSDEEDAPSAPYFYGRSQSWQTSQIAETLNPVAIRPDSEPISVIGMG